MKEKTVSVSLSRLEFLMLFSLQKCTATSPIKAITLNELRQYCPIQQSYSTFYRAIKFLYDNHLVSIGLKDGKNDTYYLNDNGISFIKECC